VTDAPQQTPAAPRRSLYRRIARRVIRVGQFFFFLVLSYFLIALVGLIPVNNGTEQSDQVEIIVTSNDVHADLILPRRNETMDWGAHLPPGHFAGDVKDATHVAFGWGNKEFYVDTRTWADVSVGTVCRALFWPFGETCMHVNMCDIKNLPATSRRATISHEQYRRLVEHVRDTFRRDSSGRFVLIEGGAYTATDAFYYAHGAYSAFNTCNCWVGRGLKAAGVRTGWFTPLPKTVYLYMSRIEAAPVRAEGQ
jgi:uncharacterized protein (TIGR02117 family)